MPDCFLCLKERAEYLDSERIKRISELTATARARELTDEEKAEREALRNEYRLSCTGNLAAQLDRISVRQPGGSVIHIKDRRKNSGTADS